ncbi:winged helix-turn-helix domain-containing protein [Streptosporangium lutulentum]
MWRDGVEIDTGPRQQTYLLALLLMRAGRPVSSSELIDLVWDDRMPTSALNIVQKYVGTLRRLLEPNLPARAPGSTSTTAAAATSSTTAAWHST